MLDQLEALEASLRRRGPVLSQDVELQHFIELLPAALEELHAVRARGDAVAAMRLLGALARFLWMQGHTRSIGLAEADATLALAAPVPAPRRAQHDRLVHDLAAFDGLRCLGIEDGRTGASVALRQAIQRALDRQAG